MEEYLYMYSSFPFSRQNDCVGTALLQDNQRFLLNHFIEDKTNVTQKLYKKDFFNFFFFFYKKMKRNVDVINFINSK